MFICMSNISNMKCFLLILAFATVSVCFDYCNEFGSYHPFCNIDCLRIPMLCDEMANKRYSHEQLQITSLNIEEILSSLNSLRQQAVFGTLAFLTNRENRRHREEFIRTYNLFPSAKEINEIVGSS